ncbi:MAG TPA: chromate efflux transporter [Gammaproteobacteria bacterium]|nr:chromate efflux transporter [Gammaproteobacteria bacterium]
MNAIVLESGERPPLPTLWQAFRVWLRIGLLSFGGPAAQIALMHREIVDLQKWLSEKQFLNALSFCMLLPGPEAMQLATYAGWRMHGVAGGLVAGLLFVLPGALVILALSLVYALYGSLPLVGALFLGVKAAVIVIVVEALLRVARRALHLAEHWVVAALAFVGIFFLALPFPLIVVAAGLFGFLRSGGGSAGELPVAVSVSPLGSLATAVTWILVWAVPLALLAVIGGGGTLLDIGLFFSRLAVVTFGGAYAVLAYLGQDVVGHYGWLDAGEMMDGLGLAETTPGPLILVNEFVGFLAGFRDGGIGAGLLGAAITLWATFVPCFLWIFVGAPYIDWIGSRPRLRGALSAITAAVVGVILNLSIWFALHVFFAEIAVRHYGPLVIWQPEFGSLDWRVILLSVISALLLFRLHWSISRVLAVASLGGLLLSSLAV